MIPLNSPVLLSRSDFLAALCLSFMMIHSPLCLADHELIVCKMLGTENTKDMKCSFFGNYLGRFLLAVFWWWWFFLPVFMYHKRHCGLSLLFLTPQRNTDNISRLLGNNSI